MVEMIMVTNALIVHACLALTMCLCCFIFVHDSSCNHTITNSTTFRRVFRIKRFFGKRALTFIRS